MYLVKCTSPFCSKTPPQYDAATPILYSWDGVLRLASFPLLPPNVTMVIMTKQFNFSFIRAQDMSPKIKVFFPVCICKLWIMTLSYQLQPASSQGILLLFWGWYAHFALKHDHLWDTEPVSFLSRMMAVYCIYTLRLYYIHYMTIVTSAFEISNME